MSSLESKIVEISDEDIIFSLERRKRKKRNALIIGSLTGLAALAGSEWFFMSEYLDDSLPFFDKAYKQIHLGCATVGVLWAFLGNMIYTTYSDHWKGKKGREAITRGVTNMARFFSRDPTKEDLAKIRAFHEAELSVVEDPILKIRAAANIDLIDGRSERAIQRLAQLTSVYRKESHLPNFVECIHWGMEELMYRIPPISKRDFSRVGLAFRRLHSGFYGSADRWMRAACKQEGPLHVQTNCLYGFFLDNVLGSNENKRREQWQSTIELILADPDVEFKMIGDSNNEVLRVVGGIIHDTFSFRRNKQSKYLKREFGISRFAHDAFNRSNEVPEPLHLSQVQDFTYLVLRWITGVPLSEIVDKENILFAVSFLQRYQVVLHGAREKLGNYGITLPHVNYRAVLHRAVERITGSPSSPLESCFDFVPEYLEKQERVLIHGDAHADNMLRSDGFSMIDQERMAFGVPQLDYARFLDSVAVSAVLPDSTPALNVVNSSEEFALTHAYAGVSNNIGVFGTLRVKGDRSPSVQLSRDIRHHVGKVFTHLDRIVEIDNKQRANIEQAKENLSEVIEER